MKRPPRVKLLASKYQTPVILCLGLFCIVLLAAIFGSRLVVRMVTEPFVLLVAVVGIYIFVGNSGIFSFGHMGLTNGCWGVCNGVANLLPGAKTIHNGGTPGLPA